MFKTNIVFINSLNGATAPLWHQDIKDCTLQLNSILLNSCVFVIYGPSTGKFKHFLTQLDMILQSLHTPKLNLVICSDINMNCLSCDKRNQMDAVLDIYNLFSTIDFPTRSYNDSFSAIDNTRLNNYQVFPLINRLSDRDMQIII
jgi:hypothetical protein